MQLSMKQISLALFLPLTLAFGALIVTIQDLKHPQISHDSCQLLGRGKSVQTFKQTAQTLYRRSGKNEDDIAFQCRDLGNVIVNDAVPFPLRNGQTVQLTIKDYQHFPKRYYMAAAIMNSTEEDAEPPSPPISQ